VLLLLLKRKIVLIAKGIVIKGPIIRILVPIGSMVVVVAVVVVVVVVRGSGGSGGSRAGVCCGGEGRGGISGGKLRVDGRWESRRNSSGV
jgi:hypothetical protein